MDVEIDIRKGSKERDGERDESRKTGGGRWGR